MKLVGKEKKTRKNWIVARGKTGVPVKMRKEALAWCNWGKVCRYTLVHIRPSREAATQWEVARGILCALSIVANRCGYCGSFGVFSLKIILRGFDWGSAEAKRRRWRPSTLVKCGFEAIRAKSKESKDVLIALLKWAAAEITARTATLLLDYLFLSFLFFCFFLSFILCRN